MNVIIAIVLCLILDSRQNKAPELEREMAIVLCLILDSRQNLPGLAVLSCRLYCALFWIQGKTRNIGKPFRPLLYCALFWIQGKT